MYVGRTNRFLVGTIAALMLAGCSATPPAPVARSTPTPSPSPSPTKVGLCQPFPDRLIDDFIGRYNAESREGLEMLVTDDRIEDVVASAYTGDSSFDGVGEWAEAGWSQHDRIRSAGYGAFHPTKDGFQMYVTRWSRALRAEGIDAVATSIDASSHGCSIDHLEMSPGSEVQAKPEPCAFYDAFGHFPAVAENEPDGCRDGTSDHARQNHVAVWAGDEALVWGGTRGGLFVWPSVALDGFTFDPANDSWDEVDPPLLPEFVPDVGVWTGRDLIVLGSKPRPNYELIAARYSPASETWERIDFPFDDWSGFEAMWTGTHVLLWGGPSHTRDLELRGALYDPVTDEWRRTSRAPIAGRDSHVAVWTGEEMIVWGGSNWRSVLGNGDGAAYNPATDTWRTIAAAPIPGRQWLPAVWTGREMIVWGGSYVSRSRADGAAYNPATDSWRRLAPSPLARRHYHSATWTGTEMIVFGGYDYDKTFGDGAAYDPVTDSWRKIARLPIDPRFTHTALWTGSRLFVFGGIEDHGHMALGDGALYDPRRDRWRRVIPDL